MDTNNPNAPRQEERRDDRSFTDKSYERYKTARKARKMYAWLRRVRIAAWAARLGTLFVGGGYTLLIAFAVVLIILFIGAIYLLLFKDDGAFRNFIQEPTTPSVPQPPPSGITPIPGLSISLPEVDPVPAGSTFTIPIDVTYSGAEDIEVIASIPEGAQFVSATGTYNQLGDVVSWRLSTNEPVSESEGSSTIPNGTIHDLGFGPSDGGRIDNFIQALRPNSPMVGQGDYIVELAREYNVDPLMIIVTVNESQMCTDNGVVSPGGSDPNNYNCGGILWDTATGTSGVDVERWNVEAGPFANGHIFAFVPTIEDGLGLFYNYIGVSSHYTGKTIEEFYEIYNPCDDPGNQGQFACGAEEARNMLEILRDYVGGATTRTYEFSFTIEAAGDNLEVRNYEISGRYVNGDAVNF